MSGLSLKVLGYGAAYPTPDRLTSSFLVSCDNNSYLIDCGEGTQMQFAKLKLKRKSLRAICITHLHGDHCFGLMGLISSLTHFQRTQTLTLIGPTGLRELVETSIKLCQIRLSYKLEFVLLEENTKGKVFEDKKVEIFTFPLKHRIHTQGYRIFESQRQPTVRKDAISEYNLEVEEILDLKKGIPVSRKGEELELSQFVTYHIPKSISICTDTIYDEELIAYIEKSNILYHEATYMEDLKIQARERMHATAKEAAEIAKKAKVDKLLIGHFSSRYTNFEVLLSEAKRVFSNTVLCSEGLEVEA